MPTTVIRGPKIPLAWSTVTWTGTVVEKHDEDDKCDRVLIEDEDGQYCTEITKLRQQLEITIEVMPTAGFSGSAPASGDLLTYAGKQLSISQNKKARMKNGAMKWTITGINCPLIHTGS